MKLVFSALSRLPLWLLHSLGWILGWCVFLMSSSYRNALRANARQAGMGFSTRLHSVGEAGKLVAELPRLWLGKSVNIAWEGRHYIDKAVAEGSGLVFLTPHLGCFEVTAQAYAQCFGQHGKPMTVLYRPARQLWLQTLMDKARERPGLETAPVTLAGVKKLIKALKVGHCVGLLPDQVPPQGQGMWLPFFGREAYTMTLSARLALQPGAVVLMAWGERLSWGRGYTVHVSPLPAVEEMSVEAWSRHINGCMEHLILRKPAQYLWAYERYKTPKAAA